MMLDIQELPWNKKILILRVARDWSQVEAAERCGTTQKVWWTWENGKKYPRYNSQRAIARIFNVSVKELFGNIEGGKHATSR
jgi:transcriptional regulator with XRE-family HTH domain